MDIRESKLLKKEEVKGVDSFHYLYEEQKKLFEKYREIEGMPNSFNIQVSETQQWVKDFIWRVSEELFEFIEAVEEKNKNHKIDELSDALHFFVEIYVILDSKEQLLLDPFLSNVEWFPFSLEDIEKVVFEIIRSLAQASNTLKNRKWKKTQVIIDPSTFFQYLNSAFFLLITLILNSFEEGREGKYWLLNLYHLKHQVNEFRIRSNY